VDAALVGAGEERVLAVEGDRTDRALDHVGVDLDATVVEEEAQPRPQLERIADGLGDTGHEHSRPVVDDLRAWLDVQLSASSLLTRSTTLKKRPRAPPRMQARAMPTAM
jgi:hypothetical protein